MMANGLMDGDVDSLKNALAALEAAGTDSDCDGVPDIQQLKDGRNPSTGEFIDGSGKPKPDPVSDAGCSSSSSGGTSDPAFGCGAHVAPGAGLTPWQAAAALAVAFGLSLTRRRRS
jgi:MYXO-CTERM domain-containing protein